MIEKDLIEVLSGRGKPLTVAGRSFRVYPQTLWKQTACSLLLSEMHYNAELAKCAPFSSMLLSVRDHRESSSRVAGLMLTENKKSSVLSEWESQPLAHWLAETLSAEELATLVLTVLCGDPSESLQESLGITSERARQSRVLAVKSGSSRNSVTFGGKSLFGGFIVPLKELGYSDEEILFEYGVGYLRLLLLDKVSTVLLTDEESEALGGSYGCELDGDTFSCAESLSTLLGSRGLRMEDLSR